MSLTAQEEASDSLFHSLDSIVLSDTTSIASFQTLLSDNENELSLEHLLTLNKKGLSASEKIASASLALDFSYNLFINHFFLGDISKGQEYVYKTLDYAILLNDTESMVNCYYNLGSIYLEQGKYALGIEYLMKVVDQSVKDKKLEQFKYYAYVSLGSLGFFYIGEHQEAINYLKEAELYVKNTQEIDLLVKIYLGIYSNYDELENKDSMQLYMHKVIQILEEIPKDSIDKEDLYLDNFLTDYANVAQYYLENNDLESATIYYNKVKNSKLSNHPRISLLDLRYFITKKDFRKAKSIIDSIPKELELEDAIELLQLKVEYYEAIGNHKQALEFTKKLKDEEIKQLKEQRVNWSDFTKAQIKEIQLEKDIDDLQIEQDAQKSLMYLSYGIILLILFLLLMSIFAYQQVKKNLKNTKLVGEKTKALQLVEQQKNKLITNITHELQTLLSIIHGLIKKIDSPNITDENYRHYITIIANNTQKLTDRVNQILDFARVDIIKPSITYHIFYLNELILQLIGELQFEAETRHIQFIFEQDKAQTLIRSDIDKLKSALKNILTNAIHHSIKKGIIDITIEDKEGLCTIQITDSGNGIPAEDLPHLFERFFQSSSKKPQGGFGIGLSISKEYIDLLEGKIIVESKQGSGSVFTVSIPKKLPATTIEEAQIERIAYHSITSQTSIPSSAPSAPKNHLLIVEDNPDFCIYLDSFLQAHFSATYVTNGEEAIQYLKTHQHPDLILTDWMMPEKDGMELISYLKEESAYQQIPTIMLTARSLVSDQIKAKKYGIDEYFLKPIDEVLLLSKIKSLTTKTEGVDNKANNASFKTLQDLKEGFLGLSIKEQEWLLKLEEVIQSNLANPNLKSLVIADAMQLSLSQLNKRIKAVTGLTTMNYVRELRYWKARKLLEEQETESVKNTCLSVGFKDVKNFSRNFKERFEKYPSDFLNN